MALKAAVADIDEWLIERGLRPMSGGMPEQEANQEPVAPPQSPGTEIDQVRLVSLRIAADVARGWPSECADEIVGIAEQFRRFLVGEDQTE